MYNTLSSQEYAINSLKTDKFKAYLFIGKCETIFYLKMNFIDPSNYKPL